MAVIRPERMLEILTSPDIDANTRRNFIYELGQANGRDYEDDEDDDWYDTECECGACVEYREEREECVSYRSDVPRVAISYDEGREPLTQERANLLLTSLREVVMSQGHFGDKVLRPWSFDPSVYDSLDPNTTWWGWEFETGYQSREDRSDVIAYVWDTWNGVTFDAEGEGWESEITFVPQEMGKFLDGTADACAFIRYLESQIDRCTTGGGPFVGTHINFSFPEFRTEDRTAPDAIRKVRNALTLSALFMEDTPEFRMKHFGRDTLYGWFYENTAWIEGKLFRTTYNSEQFKAYLNTARAFTRISRAVLDCPHEYVVCVNVTEVLENPEAPVLLRGLSRGQYLNHIPGRGEPVIHDGTTIHRGAVAVRRVIEQTAVTEVLTYN